MSVLSRVLLICALGFVAEFASADETSIRAAADAGLAEYQKDVKILQKDIRSHFDQLSEKARNRGDAKEIEAVANQRLRFDLIFLLPKSFPESFRRRQEASIKRTEKAFAAARKSALKEGLDLLSDRIDNDKTLFLADVCPVLKLAETKPKKVIVEKDWFTSDGRGLLGSGIGGAIIFDGKEYKEAILAHPPYNSYSEVVFPLDGLWETFTAQVGVPTAQDDPKRKKAGSKLTFEVRIDDDSTWTSNGTDDINTLQTCRVEIPSEAETLRLRAHCGKNGLFARTTWVEPRLSSFRYKELAGKE